MPESITTLDRHFGEWVVRHFAAGLDDGDKAMLQRLCRAVSHAVAMKHTCLDLAVYPLLGEPQLDALLQGIQPADVQRIVTPAVKPLVRSADGRRLWLQKYHAFEMAVIRALQQMHDKHRLEIITGGPGTGKTWNAAQRIKSELEKNNKCVIKLAAPTGKAANNMMNALARAGFDSSVHQLKGLTLHALLGMSGRSPRPRHHREHPLACDLLIVDEASMIDLPMMQRLLDAIPSRATLLLLGDKDQLASVEAGSVLADICRLFEHDACVRRLTESHRYQHSPEIAELAIALNAGNVPAMHTNQSVREHRLPAERTGEPAWLASALQGYAWIGEALQKQLPAEEILAQQTQFQLLCALREGPYGVQGINNTIARALGQKPDSGYPGQPVMVMQNDHDRKLYNGDVGMVLDYQGSKKACFLVNGEVRAISLAQMPAYETCYAMTVHKSQGSEYEHVMIVLPEDAGAVAANPVLTRELAYTAVTRARSRIDLWAGEAVLQAAAAKRTQRMSGLL